MRSNQTIAFAVLAVLALYVAFTVLGRLHDGRCRIGGARRGGLDCSYPAGTFTARP